MKKVMSDVASVTSECPTIAASNVSEEVFIIQTNRFQQLIKRKMEAFLDTFAQLGPTMLSALAHLRENNVEILLKTLRNKVAGNELMTDDELLIQFDGLIRNFTHDSSASEASHSTGTDSSANSTVSSIGFPSAGTVPSTTTSEDSTSNSDITRDSHFSPSIRRQFPFYVEHGNKLSVANNSEQGLENFQPAGPGQEQDPPEIAPEDGIESREGSAAPDSRQSIEASDSEQELGNDEIESLEDKNVPAANTA